MTFEANDIKAVAELLNSPKKVVITTHKSPDGDAIGSSLGLSHFLQQLGHEVNVVVPDNYPEFLQWLPGNDTVVHFDTETEQAIALTEAADVLFSLDYNDLSRIDKLGHYVHIATGIKIMIDHHQQPHDFADYTFSDTASCSTAQLVYEFMEVLEQTHLLNANIANCLYVGIMTDTGSFRFPSTTSKTHRITAALIDAGASNAAAHNNVYDSNTYLRLKLLGYALGEKLKIYPEYNTVIISLSEEELAQFNYKKGDTEGLVNYGLSIKGIKMAVFISEKGALTKLSFRSKGNFSVNQLARDHFHGGGHTNAAGGAVQQPIAEAIAQLEALLPQYKEALNS